MTNQGEKKGSVSAMLGSKSGVKRVAVMGLGKKDKEGKELTTAALEAIGAQVGTIHEGAAVSVLRVNINQFRHVIKFTPRDMGVAIDGDDDDDDDSSSQALVFGFCFSLKPLILAYIASHLL